MTDSCHDPPSHIAPSSSSLTQWQAYVSSHTPTRAEVCADPPGLANLCKTMRDTVSQDKDRGGSWTSVGLPCGEANICAQPAVNGHRAERARLPPSLPYVSQENHQRSSPRQAAAPTASRGGSERPSAVPGSRLLGVAFVVRRSSTLPPSPPFFQRRLRGWVRHTSRAIEAQGVSKKSNTIATRS